MKEQMISSKDMLVSFTVDFIYNCLLSFVNPLMIKPFVALMTKRSFFVFASYQSDSPNFFYF